jgi:hypothetical protein
MIIARIYDQLAICECLAVDIQYKDLPDTPLSYAIQTLMACVSRRAPPPHLRALCLGLAVAVLVGITPVQPLDVPAGGSRCRSNISVRGSLNGLTGSCSRRVRAATCWRRQR